MQSYDFEYPWHAEEQENILIHVGVRDITYSVARKINTIATFSCPFTQKHVVLEDTIYLALGREINDGKIQAQAHRQVQGHVERYLRQATEQEKIRRENIVQRKSKMELEKFLESYKGRQRK